MKKTGTILKEAREKKGISIYEVSSATKINTRNIMAMEEGATDRLPPKTFLRGFVASYATFLQLDTGEILKIFFEEMGSTRPEVALREQTAAEPTTSENRSKTDKSAVAALGDSKKLGYFKIYGIIGIIILIVVIGLIKRKIDSYESESVQTPPESMAGESPSPSPSPMMSANLETSTSPSVTPSPVTSVAPTASPAQQTTPMPEATPTPTPEPSATPTPKPTATPTPKASPQSTPSPTPSQAPLSTPAPEAAAIKPKPSPSPVLNAKPQDVVIEALDDVDVAIQVDGEPSKTMKLHHDEVQNIKARRKVSLKFSDGGAVNLTVNGKDRGVPGDLGKPKKVDIP